MSGYSKTLYLDGEREILFAQETFTASVIAEIEFDRSQKYPVYEYLLCKET